jgi:hypothetical protein
MAAHTANKDIHPAPPRLNGAMLFAGTLRKKHAILNHAWTVAAGVLSNSKFSYLKTVFAFSGNMQLSALNSGWLHCGTTFAVIEELRTI